jgi:hypothetical protein
LPRHTCGQERADLRRLGEDVVMAAGRRLVVEPSWATRLESLSNSFLVGTFIVCSACATPSSMALPNLSHELDAVALMSAIV